MVMVSDDVVLCPDCGEKMHKAGMAWSGRNKVQRYQCPKCGRKALPKKESGE